MKGYKKSAKEAREAGDKHYFTGKPCKYGHYSKRRAQNGTCCECKAIAQKKAYATGRYKDTHEKFRSGELRYRVVASMAKCRAKRKGGYVELTEWETEMVYLMYYFSQELEKEHGIKYSVDHIHEFQDGGKHEPYNLQVITLSENIIKGNKGRKRKQEKLDKARDDLRNALRGINGLR